ncbi:MAG: hypothetical protein ABIA04_15680 [Pseudomonadota bacterium]
MKHSKQKYKLSILTSLFIIFFISYSAFAENSSDGTATSNSDSEINGDEQIIRFYPINGQTQMSVKTIDEEATMMNVVSNPTPYHTIGLTEEEILSLSENALDKKIEEKIGEEENALRNLFAIITASKTKDEKALKKMAEDERIPEQYRILLKDILSSKGEDRALQLHELENHYKVRKYNFTGTKSLLQDPERKTNEVAWYSKGMEKGYFLQATPAHNTGAHMVQFYSAVVLSSLISDPAHFDESITSLLIPRTHAHFLTFTYFANLGSTGTMFMRNIMGTALGLKSSPGILAQSTASYLGLVLGSTMADVIWELAAEPEHWKILWRSVFNKDKVNKAENRYLRNSILEHFGYRASSGSLSFLAAVISSKMIEKGALYGALGLLNGTLKGNIKTTLISPDDAYGKAHNMSRKKIKSKLPKKMAQVQRVEAPVSILEKKLVQAGVGGKSQYVRFGKWGVRRLGGEATLLFDIISTTFMLTLAHKYEQWDQGRQQENYEERYQEAITDFNSTRKAYEIGGKRYIDLLIASTEVADKFQHLLSKYQEKHLILQSVYEQEMYQISTKYNSAINWIKWIGLNGLNVNDQEFLVGEQTGWHEPFGTKKFYAQTMDWLRIFFWGSWYPETKKHNPLSGFRPVYDIDKVLSTELKDKFENYKGDIGAAQQAINLIKQVHAGRTYQEATRIYIQKLEDQRDLKIQSAFKKHMKKSKKTLEELYIKDSKISATINKNLIYNYRDYIKSLKKVKFPSSLKEIKVSQSTHCLDILLGEAPFAQADRIYDINYCRGIIEDDFDKLLIYLGINKEEAMSTNPESQPHNSSLTNLALLHANRIFRTLIEEEQIDGALKFTVGYDITYEDLVMHEVSGFADVSRACSQRSCNMMFNPAEVMAERRKELEAQNGIERPIDEKIELNEQEKRYMNSLIVTADRMKRAFTDRATLENIKKNWSISSGENHDDGGIKKIPRIPEERSGRLSTGPGV